MKNSAQKTYKKRQRHDGSKKSERAVCHQQSQPGKLRQDEKDEAAMGSQKPNRLAAKASGDMVGGNFYLASRATRAKVC